MAVRQLTVNYRKAVHESEQTLEELLRQCLEAEVAPGVRFSESPADRVMVHHQGGREFLLNEFADVVDGVAGIICEVTPGLLQPILKRTEQTKRLTSKTISTLFEIADQSAGENEDFVQGLCYFYARHDHFLFLTVKGFRKADVQPYLNWLLNKLVRSRTNLVADVDRTMIGNDIGRVSKFRIRGRSGAGAGVALGVDKEVRTRLGAQTVAWSKAEEVVQAILPQKSFEKLIGSLGDKNRLVADVQWSVAGPRDEKVKAAIQDIVTELADLDDGLVGITGREGTINQGSVILEMTRPFEVALDTTILIDFDHATDRLVTTLQRWVEDQKIVLR